ncbi:hypothetical protein MYAM1_000574 [Malassezia yamatoensis]|uniref:Protein Zds1 C-terminal domain-containing protein n=1 Tax=Malassezia yamatoensis TaxID=253288 RepID=A0AAJ5YRD7_9BASI|nr:hypothetical protein MYAM1_000574 [Malassezia yamatoensis]
MATPEMTDFEIQREVEALRTRRRQSVHRAVLDPDLPDLHGPRSLPESRPSLDSQASSTSVASSNGYLPPTPPDLDTGAFAFDDQQKYQHAPLFGSSQRARYLARRNARVATPTEVHDKGPLPEPPSAFASEPPTLATSPSCDPMWVPAGSHPEISPTDFRRFLKEQAERNVSQHPVNTTIPSPRASLSPALDAPQGETGEAMVTANQLMRRNSSVARRSSSLRQQIRPDARHLDSHPAETSHAGPQGFSRRRGSLLTGSNESPTDRMGHVSHPTSTPNPLDQTPPSIRHENTMPTLTGSPEETVDHSRPLPPIGASQLQRNTRNMKLSRPSGPAGSLRGPRLTAQPSRPPPPVPVAGQPPIPSEQSDSMASTIEALALDSALGRRENVTLGHDAVVQEPESYISDKVSSVQGPKTAIARSSGSSGPEGPRRGNTLPTRLEEQPENLARRRAANAADVRAKVNSKELLPSLPNEQLVENTQASSEPKRRSSDRIPVPGRNLPPQVVKTPTPAPASLPARRSEEEPRLRPGPRPLPEPMRARPKSRPLPEPKGIPTSTGIEPGVSPHGMDTSKLHASSSPTALSTTPAVTPSSNTAQSAAEASRASESVNHQNYQELRPAKPETSQNAPELPPRRSAEIKGTSPQVQTTDSKAKGSDRTDYGKSVPREKRGFGLSWFGLAKEDEDDEKDKDLSGKRRKAKEEVPPPPPLLAAPNASPLTPKRKEKDTFLASLFGKRKHHEQDSLRSRARILFSGAGSSPPPLLPHDYPYTRFPLHIERALYRLSHTKLANPRRPLQDQVVISNLMFWYLSIVNSAQSRPADIGNHHPRQYGQSEYDEEQRRACRGTPPVAIHTGILTRTARQYASAQAYLPYGMGIMAPPPWNPPTEFSNMMYMNVQNQSWMPMAASSEPSTPITATGATSDYDANDYVLDSYFSGPSLHTAPKTSEPSVMNSPNEVLHNSMSTGPSWTGPESYAQASQAAFQPESTFPTIPIQNSGHNISDALNSNTNTSHASKMSVREAPGAMEKAEAHSQAFAQHERNPPPRPLRAARSSPSLGHSKTSRALPGTTHAPPIPPVPQVPSLHTGGFVAQQRS